uniref:NADH-ubiquinone oxidoreductase chain 3 n=1 Tax=Wadicosa fidelis TaxID=317852 RepID=A0A0U1XXX0_WADFI|nr:NADH dehydrogenase subunit 3 [Wadicosa fidelis]AIZ97181.1 NADH dehydrogenase subunit 3 [Wadicosa fidelis]
MFFILFVILFLVGVVYFLFLVVFYKSDYYMEILSCYECGFDPHSSTRLFFSYRFFLISILFIIFDVEISLMLPVPFLFSEMGLVVFFFFIFILLLGLMYEYFYGSLDWLDYYEVKGS